jgi:uncharacterized MnhB-related membrane protein
MAKRIIRNLFKENQMLNGYKTIIGVVITVLSSLAAIFGKDLGIDWAGVEAAATAIVGACISLYGYLVTNRGAGK